MSTTTTETTRWQDLVVWNEGEAMGSLGEMVEIAPANLDGALIEDGKIAEWQDFFIAAPGEDFDWNTPAGAVDWSGFADALQAVRG